MKPMRAAMLKLPGRNCRSMPKSCICNLSWAWIIVVMLPPSRPGLKIFMGGRPLWRMWWQRICELEIVRIDLRARPPDGVFRGKRAHVGCFMRANVEYQCASGIFVPTPAYTQIHSFSITLSHHPPWLLTFFKAVSDDLFRFKRQIYVPCLILYLTGFSTNPLGSWVWTIKYMNVALKVIVFSVVCDDLWYAKITCGESFPRVLLLLGPRECKQFQFPSAAQDSGVLVPKLPVEEEAPEPPVGALDLGEDV